MKNQSANIAGRWRALPFVIALVAAFLLPSCGEYEERSEDLGFRGLAEVDHFLAARRLVEGMGLKAFSYAGVPSFPPPADGTLVVPAASLQSEGLLGEASEWVLAGGNLVVYLVMPWDSEEPSEIDPDWTSFLSYFEFEVSKVESLSQHELEHLNVDQTLSKEKWRTQVEDGMAFQSISPLSGEVYEVDFKTRFLLRDTEEDTESPLYLPCAFYGYGDGTLTVIASSKPFANTSIDQEQHASLLWDLVAEGGGGEVWFVYSTRTSFLGLLWLRAPYAVAAFVITIIVVVWWAARGFGPKFTRGTDESPKLDEHLLASGAFFIKHRADAIVVEEYRATLLRQLARALNRPLNSTPAQLCAAAREENLLNKEQLAALSEPVADKTLVSTLRNLQSIQKQL